ncbi:unnamed protein product [Echinostoma caproni]|uniref:Uncharacterized protein n=1 Tax=Echinostoma caproni TaxID=27848 RepID=A0A3P8L5M6_9TREM|nr:unnamed protein product [Echinostoma caproni]
MSSLVEQLVGELQNRRTALDPLQSVTIYVTLSHLSYVHSVWDKLQERSETQHEALSQNITTDFLLQSPSLYESLLNAFVDGLRRCDPYILKASSQASDTDRSITVRQVVLSCLNGLAQILLRRTPKPNTIDRPAVVRALWPHVLAFGCQYGANKRSDRTIVHEAISGPDAISGNSSSSSSLPTTSDEESASSPSFGQPQKEWSQSGSQPYLANSICGIMPKPCTSGQMCTSSSEDEVNHSGFRSGTTGSLASGLLSGSPGTNQSRTYHRRHPDTSGFRRKETRDPSGRAHPTGFTNQVSTNDSSYFAATTELIK